MPTCNQLIQYLNEVGKKKGNIETGNKKQEQVTWTPEKLDSS